MQPRIAEPRGLAPIVEIRPAHETEVEACLRMILGTGSRSANSEQVIDFLSFALHRGIDVKDLWVARRNGRMIWAILPVVSPGRTMLLFSPQHITPIAAQAGPGELVEAIVEHFKSRGIKLAQVLLDPRENASQIFTGAGFSMLAELIYLQTPLRRVVPLTLPAGFTWKSYCPTSHELFAKTISASYAGSLDCPSLTGMRDIEDVIAGHKAAGEFNPRLWFMLCHHDTPCAVLLLSRTGRCETMELIYLGLIPAARGKAIGDLVMRQALYASAAEGAERISLAVDSLNTPALKLYERHGLERICSRLALIRELA